MSTSPPDPSYTVPTASGAGPPPARRRPAPRRSAKPLWIVLLVLLVVALLIVGGDRLVRDRAEGLIGEAVAEAIGVPVEATVEGPLAGLRLLALDEVSTLRLHARGVALPEAGTSLDVLSVTVVGLRLDGEQRPVGGSGTFSASMTPAQVRAAVPDVLADRVDLGEDAVLIDLGFTAIPLELAVVEGALRIQLPGDAPLLDMLLGDLTEVPLLVPDGVVVTTADVVDGTLELSGLLDPVVVAEGR